MIKIQNKRKLKPTTNMFQRYVSTIHLPCHYGQGTILENRIQLFSIKLKNKNITSGYWCFSGSSEVRRNIEQLILNIKP